MDGFEATAVVREKEKASRAHLPIIAPTASAMKEDRERCLEAGMDAYVAKPITPDELFATIETLVPSHENPARIEFARTNPGDALDTKTLLARVDGDAQLLCELVGMFLQECPRMMEDIRQALANHDSKALERAAHALKGSVGNFSAGGAAESALQLERIARSGNLEVALSAFRHLEDEIAQFVLVLADLGKGVGACES